MVDVRISLEFRITSGQRSLGDIMELAKPLVKEKGPCMGFYEPGKWVKKVSDVRRIRLNGSLREHLTVNESRNKKV